MAAADGAPAASGERIRVGLFVNSVQVGGMEQHVELLARHLDRKQFEVFAFCPEWAPTHSFSKKLSETAEHFYLITPDRRHGRGLFVLETAKLGFLLRKWRIQVLHMHSTTYRGQLSALLAARMAGVPRIFVTEHLAPEQALPARDNLTREVFTRFITGVVCVSEKNRERREQHLYTPADRTFVVNNGVDLDDFAPIAESTLTDLRRRTGIPADAQVVGTAIRFEPDKGLDDLLNALPAIKAAHPKTIFLMVGDGSLRGELTAHAARLGLADSVRFVGFQKDPRPYIALMDVFVLPVPVGSASIALLEAMAMSRAVIITFGQKGEAVIPGESGFFAEPHNPGSIAEFANKILASAELKRALGAGARRRVEDEFSAQRVARALEDLYRGHAGK